MYQTRPFYSMARPYNYYGYPVYYSGFCQPGGYWCRPFPYYEPRIYVYPTPVAPAYQGYRRIIILNPAKDDLDATPDHTLPPIPEEAAYRRLPRPESIDPDEAWVYMEQGEYQKALSAFGALAARGQDEGITKIGFGLAAAMQGDKITAAYALRRAFETDPESVRQVPLSPSLRQSLRRLAASYEERLQKNTCDSHVRFLFAAISHLVGNDAEALACLDQAMAAGDHSASATGLKKMLSAN